MKTFKEFIQTYMEDAVPVNAIASGTGPTHIAKYDPLMKFKMFRRKPKKGAKK